MDINGTWKLKSADNVPEICEALGVKEEYKLQAIQLMSPGGGVTQTINVEGDAVSVSYNIPGKVTAIKTKLGEPAQMTFFDGRLITCVFSIEGNKLLEKQSGAYDALSVRCRQGEQLIHTTTAKNVTATRVYEKD